MILFRTHFFSFYLNQRGGAFVTTLACINTCTGLACVQHSVLLFCNWIVYNFLYYIETLTDWIYWFPVWHAVFALAATLSCNFNVWYYVTGDYSLISLTLVLWRLSALSPAKPAFTTKMQLVFEQFFVLHCDSFVDMGQCNAISLPVGQDAT